MAFRGNLLTDHLLKQRLLQDIAELQQKPYPGIQLHMHETDITRACLWLTPAGEAQLHLTLYFTSHYPLIPPDVTIQTSISHPNVFNDRLCLNMLVSDDGYTPAYTLKSICIQLLSFFASDTIEQMWGEHGGNVDRRKWQARGDDGFGLNVQRDTFKCKQCGHGEQSRDSMMGGVSQALQATTMATPASSSASAPATSLPKDPNPTRTKLQDLPSEILLLVLDNLEVEHILTAARAWDGFGRVARQYNIIRTRELQCFTLKQGFRELELGIGVQVQHRDPKTSSEFDLISREAFEKLAVRTSIQGLPFTLWLPLPLAENHWTRVKKHAQQDISLVARAASINGPTEDVIYTMMNHVVVQLSKEAESLAAHGYRNHAAKSTLTHASEKAIESYFHLFHLLLCLACDKPEIARNANTLIANFVAGQRSKEKVRNLGWLLIMTLISDVEVATNPENAEKWNTFIIQEAITRNVVWMLDSRGSNMAELSFMETDKVSSYRLEKTFDASTTSYRLLMFQDYMRRIVRKSRNAKDPVTGVERTLTLPELRDSLFARHGAPPENAAAELAANIREIHGVQNFPTFLKIMSITPQQPQNFTNFLRGSVKASMEKDYSKWALTQEQALTLRLEVEPNVGRPEGMVAEALKIRNNLSFFPGQQRGGGNSGRGGRGGRDGRGGRGRGRAR